MQGEQDAQKEEDIEYQAEMDDDLSGETADSMIKWVQGKMLSASQLPPSPFHWVRICM